MSLEFDPEHVGLLEGLVESGSAEGSLAEVVDGLLMLAAGSRMEDVVNQIGVPAKRLVRAARQLRSAGLDGLRGFGRSEGIPAANVKRLIREEERIVASLHARVHQTFLRRDIDRQTWLAACLAFHSHRSRIATWLDRAYRERVYTDQRLMEFAVVYLELDPRYFRSGYHKEVMLTRIKRSPIDPITRERLTKVLLDAVARRGSREFKHYCRLALVISDRTFEDRVKVDLSASDRQRAARARLMLRRIDNHRGQDTVGGDQR